MTREEWEGAAYFTGFVASIPIANWMIGNLGTYCVPGGPCLIPVAPGLTAPSGVLMVGLALVLRDLVQRRLGKMYSIIAIIIGAGLSGLVAPPELAVASVTAFLFSELADFAVYTPLEQKRLIVAVAASSVVGLVIDSLIFLYLAFGNLDYLAGQVVGKSWMVLLAVPAIWWIREREKRSGLVLCSDRGTRC